MEFLIIGAGGFGREVLDVAIARNSDPAVIGSEGVLKFLGFVDDGQPDEDRLARIGAPYLGGTRALSRFAGAGFVVGVGHPDTRARLAQRVEDAGLVPITLVHPSATLGGDVEIGAGSVVCAGVRITTNVRIGRHVHLNLNVTVGHDAVVEDYVTVNPLAAISGDVVLGKGVMVGTTACVNQGRLVGEGSVVGSGAAVVKDVQPNTTVAGVPARTLE